MVIKMSPAATEKEVRAVESKISELGYKLGRLKGTGIVLIGVYGDIHIFPAEDIREMSGVETLIPISSPYKRAAQKGYPGAYVHNTVKIGNVAVGGNDRVLIAGPCSVESETQIMKAADMIKTAGGHVLRGGVVKYRSSPYSGWEGIGLDPGLKLIVRAGKEFGLPTVVEILDPHDVPKYEDTGVDCFQIGEPNCRSQALLNRLRDTPLPVIHKRGNALSIDAYLLWVERILSTGKENVILCERGIMAPNGHTRNVLDLVGIAVLRRVSCLPVVVDPSHGTGDRDLVFKATLAGIIMGASGALVEAHPNPLIAKSDGPQGLYYEQLTNLMIAMRTLDASCMPWIQSLDVSDYSLKEIYSAKAARDKEEFFGLPASRAV